ncbi:MAG: metalloregulator ArsR/SmtB family transcription factor [Candidatus Paceibacterota bacterium]
MRSNTMIDPEYFEKVAQIYKVLGSRKRLEIINTLGKGELSVDDLSKILKISSSNLSQHLSHLRYVQLVKTRRYGAKVFYRLSDAKLLDLGERFRVYLKAIK